MLCCHIWTATCRQCQDGVVVFHHTYSGVQHSLIGMVTKILSNVLSTAVSEYRLSYPFEDKLDF